MFGIDSEVKHDYAPPWVPLGRHAEITSFAAMPAMFSGSLTARDEGCVPLEPLHLD